MSQILNARLLDLRRHRGRHLHDLRARTPDPVRVHRAAELRSCGVHGDRRLHDGDPGRQGRHAAMGGVADRDRCGDGVRLVDRHTDAAPSRRLPGDHDHRVRRDRSLRRAQRIGPDRRTPGDGSRWQAGEPDRASTTRAGSRSRRIVQRPRCAIPFPAPSAGIRTSRCCSSSGSWRSSCSASPSSRSAPPGDVCSGRSARTRMLRPPLGKNVVLVQAAGARRRALRSARSPGLFYAFQFSFFSPPDFAPLTTFFAYVIVILGGIGRVWAVPVGVHHLRPASSPERGSSPSRRSRCSAPADRAYVRLIIIGLILIGLMAFRPQGLFGKKEELTI